MNWKIVGILIAIVVSCSCAKWAVLVAGSNTWSNYRHQADVFHAYRMLIAKGFDPTKIIVMAYNDIANDTRNKFPGKVFNKPSNS
jgi:legumain